MITAAKALYPEYNVDVLLEFIGNLEAPMSVAQAQGKTSQYDVVWGGIAPRDRPKCLREMSVREVLNWQDSIDARYNSEAAGKYQIMEDTLRGIPVDRSSKFDERMQDICALALLEKRGLKDFLRGETSKEKFALSLAKEWASFPVPFNILSANGEVIKKAGTSYYPSNNKALIDVKSVLQTLELVRGEKKAVELSDGEKLKILWDDYQKRSAG